MNIYLKAVVFVLFVAGSACASGSGNDIDRKAHKIIELKCTRCHNDTQIDTAYAAGKDMDAIIKNMERRGVVLSGNEKEVLGIFWKIKEPKKL